MGEQRFPVFVFLGVFGMTMVNARQQLKSRRYHLRKQRRIKFATAVWRSLALVGMTWGAWAIATESHWVIHNPQQIEIKGNDYLTTDTVQALIPLDYPQKLLTIKPQQLQAQLESRGPIARADVSRRLLPPGLTVAIQESNPVAQVPLQVYNARTNSHQVLKGYVDAWGNWMPEESYNGFGDRLDLPKLTVIGMTPRQLKQWPQIYQAIEGSEVSVMAINWQDRQNLILQTAIGVIYCGDDLTLLPRQLMTVQHRLQDLPKRLGRETLKYIDLRNPDKPSVIMESKP